MTGNRLTSLIVQKISGALTEREAQELEAWAGLEPSNRAFLDRATDEKLLEQELDLWKNIDPAKGYAKWETHMQVRRRTRIRRIVGWSVAASLLIAVAIGGLMRRSVNLEPQTPVIAKAAEPVVSAGRSTATLTLAGGQQILLDSVGSGNLAMQGNVRLTKIDDKSIAYAGVSENEGVVLYNTLSTPRSGQYKLVLPDHTQVWLNNVSTLRYPTSFNGKDRTVELLGGEAYFEIAKNAAKPFFVKVKDEMVEVLGTSFNIKDFEEEGMGIQTTLLSGEVRVKAGAVSVQLKPDEQARVGTDGLTVLKGVPSQDIISWKNGFFYFGRASLKEVMFQLARWYDVDVVYQGKVPDIEFGGKIDRSLPLNELLNFLDKNQVHLRLDGRKIIVLP